MTDTELAQLSNTAFNVAFFAYLAAMIAYFFRLAFTKVSAEGVQASTTTGRRIGILGLGLLVIGFTIHLVSVGSRALAAGRVPLGNMYEYGSAEGDRSTVAYVVVAWTLVVTRAGEEIGRVGVNLQDSVTNARSFERDQQVNYPSIVDGDARVAAAFGGIAPEALPSTILIDGDGRAAVRLFGAVSAATLEPYLDALLAEA